jgi:hypothetical protein
LPAVPAESSKKKRTRDRLRRLEKKKLSRQVKRKRDAAARASSSNDVCTRDIAKNHIHSCKAVLTPMELKKVRVTKPGWIGLKDVKGKKGKKGKRERRERKLGMMPGFHGRWMSWWRRDLR